jgi:hypothetical protein
MLKLILIIIMPSNIWSNFDILENCNTREFMATCRNKSLNNKILGVEVFMPEADKT